MPRYIHQTVDLRSRAKRRQAGCNTVAKQPNTLGVGRATAWILLNRDRRAGPSAKIIKRILSSPNLPPAVRRRVEEYIEEKIEGVYGHREVRRRSFAEQFNTREKKSDSAA